MVVLIGGGVQTINCVLIFADKKINVVHVWLGPNFTSIRDSSNNFESLIEYMIFG